MGDHDDGLPLGVDPPEQVQDHPRVVGVELAGGLVGEDGGRAAHQGPGDAHALGLPARQHRGVLAPIRLGQADQVQEAVAPLAHPGAPALDQQADRHEVVDDAELVQQVHLLEDESAVVAPEPGQGVLVQAGDVDAVDLHPPQAGPVQAGQGVEQRRLARPGGPHDDGEGAALDLQVQVAQHVLLAAPVGEGPREPLGADDDVGGHGVSFRPLPRYGRGDDERTTELRRFPDDSPTIRRSRRRPAGARRPLRRGRRPADAVRRRRSGRPGRDLRPGAA